MLKMLEQKKQEIAENIEYYQNEIEKEQSKMDLIDDMIDEYKEKEEAKEREQSFADIRNNNTVL